MKILSGDMIFPEFRGNNCYHEAGSKTEFILFRVRNIVAVYKKETSFLFDYGKIDIYEINRIDIVMGRDHGEGVFRFPIKKNVHDE